MLFSWLEQILKYSYGAIVNPLHHVTVNSIQRFQSFKVATFRQVLNALLKTLILIWLMKVLLLLRKKYFLYIPIRTLIFKLWSPTVAPPLTKGYDWNILNLHSLRKQSAMILRTISELLYKLLIIFPLRTMDPEINKL